MTSSFATTLSARKRRAAFSLMELAIVLGVIGVVLGGLWSVITWGIENQREEQAREQIASVTQAVRSLMAGQSFITIDAPALMTRLVAANAISSTMVRVNQTTCLSTTTCVDSPWGPAQYSGSSASTIDNKGTFQVMPWVLGWTVCPASCASNNVYFAVSIRNLSSTACAALIEYVESPAAPPGLADIVVQQVSMYNNGVFRLPVPSSTVGTYCKPTGTNTQVYANFVYKLGLSY